MNALPPQLTVTAMLVAILCYMGISIWRRHYVQGEPFSAAYISDERHPSIIGIVVCALCASALMSGLYSIYRVIEYLRLPPEARASAAVPSLPTEIVILGLASLVWISVQTILDVITDKPADRSADAESKKAKAEAELLLAMANYEYAISGHGRDASEALEAVPSDDEVKEAREKLVRSLAEARLHGGNVETETPHKNESLIDHAVSKIMVARGGSSALSGSATAEPGGPSSLPQKADFDE